MKTTVVYLLLLHYSAMPNVYGQVPIGGPFAAYSNKDLCEAMSLLLADDFAKAKTKAWIECIPLTLDLFVVK